MLCEKNPINIKFKAKQRIITAPMNVLINSVFATKIMVIGVPIDSTLIT